MTGDRFTDSAGQPWAGRHFDATPFADDDGTAPPRLLEALRRRRSGELGPSEVVEALRGTRLLVPMLAVLGEAAIGPHGKPVDKSADLAIVTVAARDGRRVLPAFTSVEAMTAWNPRARPIPVEAERVAVAAASEGTDLVVIDPASDTEHGLRRSALEALATGTPYLPCWVDPEVVEAFGASLEAESSVESARLGPATEPMVLDGPELAVALVLLPGLDENRLALLIERVTARWAADPVIATRVDGVTVKLVAAA